MAKITKDTARSMARKSALKKAEMQGRYIVAYKLNRKNAKRHECFRASTIEECLQYVRNHITTDRYFTILDYNWKPIM